MSNWPTTQHLLMPTRCLIALDKIRSALTDRTDAIDMVETIYGIAHRALRPDAPRTAQAGEARRAETTKIGSVHEHAVAEGMRPTMNRLDRMRIEWEAERRMILARIAEEKFRLRDVEHRLRVFFPGG